MKKNIIALCIFTFLIGTGCEKRIVNEKYKFNEDINNLLNHINIDITEGEKKYYYSENGELNEYSSIGKIDQTSVLLSKYNLKNVGISINPNGDLQYSIISDKYCAIKGYNEKNFSVYSSDDKNCYKYVYYGDELHLYIAQYNLPEQIVIVAATNLTIFDAAEFTWYKDGVVLQGSNYSSITVDPNDTSTYYVVINLLNGEEYISNEIVANSKNSLE